jgi:crossover junction endonuclease MUS81
MFSVLVLKYFYIFILLMYLLIDYREQDFIKKLSEFTFIENDVLKTITIKDKDIHFKITNLIVGDFIIRESLEDLNSIKVVIERKSIQDLNSSIKDNRFREQKGRLLESIGDPSKICYLIEGNDKKMPKNILNGALLNLVFKHCYKLIQSVDALDSFDKIITLYKKFSLNEFENIPVVKNVQMIKKSDNIKNNKFLNQLCLVNGVSVNIAGILLEWLKNEHNVTNIKSFIDLYNKMENEKEKEMLFSDIKISSKKIGKALSKKIYEYFCI